jgi:hypothetical protein
MYFMLVEEVAEIGVVSLLEGQVVLVAVVQEATVQIASEVLHQLQELLILAVVVVASVVKEAQRVTVVQ